MKKILSIIFIVISGLILSSCQSNTRIDVITTLFPQYDITKAIVGDTLIVENILPFGVSPHGYELTSKDRQKIEDATLLIYTSDELEFWVEDLNFPNTYKLNLELELESHDDHDGHEDETHEDHEDHEDHEEHDVHFWTSPSYLIEMVHIILDHLVELFPEYETTFTTSAQTYLDEFDVLVNDLEDFLSLYLNEITLFIAGHNAMADFGAFFNLEINSLFPNFIPDAELTSLNLTTFISEIREKNITSFFIEPTFGSVPLAANTIKSTLATDGYTISFYELSNFENISQTDYALGIDLLDLFARNIDHIKLVVEANYGTR
jgi:zinc transport system substrate-binding protein